jgi:hypothetical protein
MSRRPASVPVLLREQREEVGRRAASHAFVSREFRWGREAPDERRAELQT